MAVNIMIQGTMSNAGKSLITAGLCRVFAQDGYWVAPFKSQNMALNSYVTEEGLEMGRAQVVQAEACGKKPSVLMNPILLKPTTDVGSQVIVMGKVRSNMKAGDYFKYKKSLIPEIMEAYRKLAAENDIIVIEGAGSPAEINLKADDIVNMGLAKLVDAPVLLVGDIDRGGVFAQLAGTMMLLEEEEKARIKGMIINKFRGDVSILEPGLKMIEDICQKPVIGVVPYEQLDIEDEDSLSEKLENKGECESRRADAPMRARRNTDDCVRRANGADAGIGARNTDEKDGAFDVPKRNNQDADDCAGRGCEADAGIGARNIDEKDGAFDAPKRNDQDADDCVRRANGAEAGIGARNIDEKGGAFDAPMRNDQDADDCAGRGCEADAGIGARNTDEKNEASDAPMRARDDRCREDEKGFIDIAVIRLPRISNFTDFAALEAVDGARVRYADAPSELAEADIIVLPGTKSTMSDLDWLRRTGLAAQIVRRGRAGAVVIGICGGYQMLGNTITDLTGAESEHCDAAAALGLLPVNTVFQEEKTLGLTSGVIAEIQGPFASLAGLSVSGYEIHMGTSVIDTDYSEQCKPLILLDQKNDPERNADHSDFCSSGVPQHTDGCVFGNIMGTYLHGIFDSSAFTEALLAIAARRKGLDQKTFAVPDRQAYKESQYDRLAEMIRSSLDMEKIYNIMGIERERTCAIPAGLPTLPASSPGIRRQRACTIRQMQPGDLDEIMRIWLESNRQAHSFIPASYWEEKSAPVREMIKQAEIYVALSGEALTGFVGLTDGYIAGIFVSEAFRGQGIGTALLAESKRRFSELSLHVYVKNEQAVQFYENENFSVCEKMTEEETGEEEYLMMWRQIGEKPEE